MSASEVNVENPDVIVTPESRIFRLKILNEQCNFLGLYCVRKGKKIRWLGDLGRHTPIDSNR